MKIKYIKARQIRPYVASVVRRNFSSARVSERPFSEFEGRVIQRKDDDYEAQCYQYASSSYLDKGIVKPAAIIKATDESDVIKAIKYASDNKIAVAVRTGGHQYCGASSTSGKTFNSIYPRRTRILYGTIRILRQ